MFENGDTPYISIGGSMNKITIALALALTFSAPAFSDDVEEPELDQSAYSGDICLTHSAAAAIGAMGRYAGAPLVFKYTSAEKINVLYRKPDATGNMLYREYDDLPKDAIYVFEEYNLEQRKNFEVSAMFGWKQTDIWIKDKRPAVDKTILAPIFYGHCKQQMEKTNEH